MKIFSAQLKGLSKYRRLAFFFLEHCFNISWDVVYSVHCILPFLVANNNNDIITALICIIEKRQYLSNEKRCLKKNWILKGLSNEQKIFLMSYAL